MFIAGVLRVLSEQLCFLERFVLFRVYRFTDLQVFWPVTTLFTTREQAFFLTVVIRVVTFIQCVVEELKYTSLVTVAKEGYCAD